MSTIRSIKLDSTDFVMIFLLFLVLDMSDDSSSEDEITKRILEDSIDNDLLTNDLYSNGSKKKKSADKIKSMLHIIMLLLRLTLFYHADSSLLCMFLKLKYY